jgi:hypothetical protein
MTITKSELLARLLYNSLVSGDSDIRLRVCTVIHQMSRHRMVVGRASVVSKPAQPCELD